MKIIFKTIVTAAIVTLTMCAHAQDARSLLQEGIQLDNAKNYSGAIEKYKAALLTEPDNISANYQLAFALHATGKGEEALPYLQKVISSTSSVNIIKSAYGLMGSIYDRLGQVKKAIESYQAGIKAEPTDQALNYSLGLAYFRDRQYNLAENSAVEAIRIDPKHSGSMRLYALVTFHQDKRAPALLALCNYLWLEPNGLRSAEAYENIKHILQGGTLKLEPGVAKPKVEATDLALNQAITQAVTLTAARKHATAASELSEQLQSIFNAVGTLAEKQNGKDYFHAQLAPWYLKLAKSNNIPAFTRVISQHEDKAAAAWLKANPQQVAALTEWIKANP
jgi:tetratricopeptide (TPR) repeat protein